MSNMIKQRSGEGIGKSGIAEAAWEGESGRFFYWPGNLILPLRLVLGWTYFSAFWRRLVLENKLDMDGPGYVGEKFNHFLPNAWLIQPQIEFFLLRPDWLWWKLVVFTLIEAVVGFALIFGIATRATGIATSALAMGILLGAGWLGTTCLDEWQIGTLGLAAGLAVFFAGGGAYSFDRLFQRRGLRLPKWLQWSIEPGLVTSTIFRKAVVPAAVGLALLTLATNQVFHGGVWGTLHNKSVKPLVEISHIHADGDKLTARFYRVEGADVYGSFGIAVRVMNAADQELLIWDAASLAQMRSEQFRNYYIASVKPGKNSLIFPLGAKTDVTFEHPELRSLAAGSYRLELEDISGARWSAPFVLP